MNNFEKIKNMSLDEMARWLSNWCKIFSDEAIKFRLNDYRKATKQWLQQETKN